MLLLQQQTVPSCHPHMGQKARKANLCYLSSSLKFPPAQKHSKEEAQAATCRCSMNHQFWQVTWFIVLGVKGKELGEILVSQSLMHCWQSKWPRVQGTWSQCLSHPSWSLAGSSSADTPSSVQGLGSMLVSPLPSPIHARTGAQSKTKHSGHWELTLLLQETQLHPDPCSFSWSLHRNSNKHNPTQSTLIFPVYVQLLEEFCWPSLQTELPKGAPSSPAMPKFQLYLRSARSPHSAAPAGTSSCWCPSGSLWCCLHSLPDFPWWSSWKGKKTKAGMGKIILLDTLGRCCW